MKYRSIAAIILGIITSGCSALVSKVFPLDDLPAPPGPHNVGTRFFEWVDTTRGESFTDNPDDQRRLVGQIWYPTVACAWRCRSTVFRSPRTEARYVGVSIGLASFHAPAYAAG